MSAFNVGLVVESSGNSCMIASIFSAEAQGGDGEKSEEYPRRNEGA